MSAATKYPSVREALNGSDRASLCDVPWDAYVAMRDDDASRHVRMDYFRGTLELMSPKYRHEKPASRLAYFVLTFAEIMKIECTESRSTTLQRKDEGAGKEADTSFYIANEPLIRDKDDIDLEVDPPPDLAIEVDNFNNSKGKLPIYAALRVPEVWRYDARSGGLWFGRLQADGTYRTIEQSEALLLLTPGLVLEALALGKGMAQSRWGELLRKWVRKLRPTPAPGKHPKKPKAKGNGE